MCQKSGYAPSTTLSLSRSLSLSRARALSLSLSLSHTLSLALSLSLSLSRSHSLALSLSLSLSLSSPARTRARKLGLLRACAASYFHTMRASLSLSPAFSSLCLCFPPKYKHFMRAFPLSEHRRRNTPSSPIHANSARRYDKCSSGRSCGRPAHEPRDRKWV
jgi:hypothetical protein